jgi:thioredoxin-dependent peroxiredoxin
MPPKVTVKGSPLTLVGRAAKVGMPAPDFKVTSQDMTEVTLADFSGKIKVITTFPSLDTPVCDLQVKEFNRRAKGLSEDVVILGISKDLPFAQRRFCDSFHIRDITVLSDYKTSSLGINYGLLIKEMNLLARSVLIADKNNVLRYIQIVEELSTPPRYDEALAKLAGVLKDPAAAVQETLPAHCRPCEIGTPALAAEKIEKLLRDLKGWDFLEGIKLVKEFTFKDFIEAKYFLDVVSFIAEEQGHHPTMTIIYNKVRITLTTHAAKGLTENDFIMAKFIDEIQAQ